MVPTLALLMTLQTPVTPTPGLTLTRTATFRPGVYRLPSTDNSGQTAALTIRGDNLVLDFRGVTLEGTPPTVDPDQRVGTGVRVTGKNITIRNLRARGYKIGLIAVDAPGLKLLDCDLSYNWKQRLRSTQDREDLADWMSFHRNENDEWLRYGAGVYLRRCNNFEVKGLRVVGGQCGLMIMDSNQGRVWNSNFSFLSAVGLGLYLSSDNRIMHNRIDWCVRGYSHGRWNRGQDSTGILIYEQCHRNVFAYNSVTHGGDGFFLWAGQSTMDTGQGGCNDNLLYGNDWSHAPTNGIEATFSRNNFVNNLIMECWHGIWGGYSYDSKVIGNVFALNAEAIAWEHGQDNLVQNNVFHRDNEAIYLWSNPTQDPNWGFPKHRDTRSRDWKIERNLFSHVATHALRVRRTEGVEFARNQLDRVGTAVNVATDVARLLTPGNSGTTEKPSAGAPEIGVQVAPENAPMPSTMQPSGNVRLGMDPATSDYLARFALPWYPWPNRTIPTAKTELERIVAANTAEARPYAPAPLRGGIDPFLKSGTLRGRRYILVDEWGPYDFKSPRLWPRMESAGEMAPGVPVRFEVLGPKGRWRVLKADGAALSESQGAVPGYVTLTLAEGGVSEVNVELEYVGEATTDVRGIVTPAGKPVRFGWKQFVLPIAWDVRFFAWNKDQSDPRTQVAAWELTLTGAPLATVKRSRLDYQGFGRFEPNVPANHFTTLADGTFTIAPGEYILEVTTDDGARVWLDDRLVVEDAWKYQGPTAYNRRVRLGGTHRLRVQHFQIDGYATLKVTVRKP